MNYKFKLQDFKYPSSYTKLHGQNSPCPTVHVHSLFIDYPTDEELEEVAKEIMGKLQQDWTQLQAYLGIPEDVMLEVQSQPTIRQRVRGMLREWRDGSEDGSRARLAECLKAADRRLGRTASKLLAGEYRTLSLTPSSSRSGSTNS